MNQKQTRDWWKVASLVAGKYQASLDCQNLTRDTNRIRDSATTLAGLLQRIEIASTRNWQAARKVAVSDYRRTALFDIMVNKRSMQDTVNLAVGPTRKPMSAFWNGFRSSMFLSPQPTLLLAAMFTVSSRLRAKELGSRRPPTTAMATLLRWFPCTAHVTHLRVT